MSRHGTASGARRHQSLGEPLCPECRKSETGRRVPYDQARRKALAALSAMHPTEYMALLAKFKIEAGMKPRRGVTKAMTMTTAEKALARSRAWQAATKRLIEKYRTEFDEMYEHEKAERGL